MQGVEVLKRYMFDMESESNQKALKTIDLSLDVLNWDLEKLKKEYIGRSQLFNKEIQEKLEAYSNTVESKGLSMLELIDKSDTSYQSEIRSLKNEVQKLQHSLKNLDHQLDNSRTTEVSLNSKIHELLNKISVLENVEESNKGTWFDNPQQAHNLDLSTSVDIEKINRILKKSVDTIAALEARLLSANQQS